MASKTGIEWTDATWNPTRGCSRISPGCANCYAERIAARFGAPGLPYAGLTRIGRKDTRAQWTGQVRLSPAALAAPFAWRTPRRVFVNSMSDLFHERISDEDIAKVFVRMLLAERHTFQVLTKRAARMRLWCHTGKPRVLAQLERWVNAHTGWARFSDGRTPVVRHREWIDRWSAGGNWPLPNVWLGVSVEDQQRANERIPHLLATPAAIRFVSAEPLLGPMDLSAYVRGPCERAYGPPGSSVDWVIVGGESGPGARPCDVAWVRRVVADCRAAAMPVFVKQLGSQPIYRLEDLPDELARQIDAADEMDPFYSAGGAIVPGRKKGGNMADWPEDLRVRQFPGAPTARAGEPDARDRAGADARL